MEDSATHESALVVLDCIGYDGLTRDQIQAALGVPTIHALSAAMSVVGQLLS
jgi:hypothetical protein